MGKLLEDESFETGIRRIGAEQEMFIVDEDNQPAPKIFFISAQH